MCFWNGLVYPRMKVRDDGDPVGVEEENDALFAVEHFLSMEDPCTPGTCASCSVFSSVFLLPCVGHELGTFFLS